ncbi:MAG: histidine phosphatase family protein [Planctomycetota bacterium]|nr:histidine phosphatase family protein [Planctomycetota bacterium]
MKRFFGSVLVCCFWLPASLVVGQEVVSGLEESEGTTLFWVVRHADRDGKKDALTQKGLERAEKLSRLAAPVKVDAVYSTDLNRTRLTAKPTAKEKKKEILIYRKLTRAWFEAIKKKHRGKGVVLIVGHSNTVVPIVRGLGGKLDYEIGENEFDKLFVVKVNHEKTTVARVEYGN